MISGFLLGEFTSKNGQNGLSGISQEPRAAPKNAAYQTDGHGPEKGKNALIRTNGPFLAEIG